MANSSSKELPNSFDAIIVGSGHNGLVAGCYLQRAGLKVLVVEKNPWIGGATTSRSLTEGVTYSNCSYVCSLFRPEIIRDLELDRHGLQIVAYEGGVLFTQDGDYLASHRDHFLGKREIARHSRHDADAYDRYMRDVTRQCRLIQPLLMRTAPDPASLKPRDLGELLFLLRRMSGLTSREMADTVRFWTMSISDYLDEYFESGVVKASLAVSGIIGTALGPMSPGTAYVLLHHYMGEVDGNIGAWGYARGAMGAVSSALARAFEASGGMILTDAEVAEVRIRDGCAAGIELANGDAYRAATVVSGADVKRTFLKLVKADLLPPEYLRKVENFKIRGSSGKINIALEGMPEFPALPRGHPSVRGDIHFTDSIERMERAYDDWKAGRWSADPMLDMMIPSTVDPTLAAPGKHFMSCFVQYCPPKVEGREWTDKDRDGFAESVIGQIAEYSPGFRDRIIHAEVRTPRELEAEVGLTEGNIFQGELTLDQIFFNRPFPGYAQYRSPVQGLYLCGSSAHPGGGVMGAPGRNAAREILRDLARPQDHLRDAYEVL